MLEKFKIIVRHAGNLSFTRARLIQISFVGTRNVHKNNSQITLEPYRRYKEGKHAIPVADIKRSVLFRRMSLNLHLWHPLHFCFSVKNILVASTIVFVSMALRGNLQD